MAALALGGAGIVTSLLGGIFGAGAARKAAAIQAAAAQQAAQQTQQTAMTAGQGVTSAAGNAANLVNTATGGAADLYANLYNEQMSRLSPYQGVGTEAANQLLTGLQSGDLTKTFTGADMAAYDPGYAFRLAQGQKAVGAATAAAGSTLGGAALKGMQRYTQDYASNEYQNAFNRFMAQQQQKMNVLTTGIGVGQNATSQQLSAINSLATPIGQMGINAATYAGNTGINANQWAGNALMQGQQVASGYLTDAAKAQAGGIVGANNALWGGVSGAVGSAAGAYGMYQGQQNFNALMQSRVRPTINLGMTTPAWQTAPSIYNQPGAYPYPNLYPNYPMPR